MKEKTYEKMIGTVGSSESLLNGVLIANRVLTRLSYIVYPLFLIFIAVKKEPELIKAITVPAISFIIVSVFRYLCCAPRPYEIFKITPLIKKILKENPFQADTFFLLL